MKTLNYLFSAAMIAAIATSCNDDDYIDEKSSSVSPESNYEFSAAELEKMAYGCEYYLDEDTTQKIETRASDRYLSFVNEQLEKQSLSTSHLKSASLYGEVGVVKINTCGQYAEIKVLFDSENSKNNNKSYGYGNNTSWNVKQNLIMYFCLVPAEKFTYIGKDYAVLKMTERMTSEIKDRNNNLLPLSIIELHMDAEDEGNPFGSVALISNKTVTENEGRSYFKPNLMDDKYKDLTMQFVYFSDEFNYGVLPNLGFEYGVFGKIYYNDRDNKGDFQMGYIYSDDQDRRNANSVRALYASSQTDWKVNEDKTYYNSKGNCTLFNTNFRNIFGIGENTTFYISRVK